MGRAGRLFAEDESCSFICFSFGDMLFILLFPVAIVWSLGSSVVYIVLRVQSNSSSGIHGGHDT